MHNELEVKFPDKLKFLFEPHRYKVPYGGRGSAKSFSVAQALILIADMVQIKVLCFREVQKSIKESVHSLLKRQIKRLKLSHRYEVLDNEIRNKVTGSLFIFYGLSTLTEDNIKSLDDVDIAWGEEANTLSKSSIEVLRPTIRKDETNIYDWHPEYKHKKWSSEIWLTFNPDLDTDPVYEEFVIKTPTDCVARLINFMDNPFFPQVLEQERLDCLRDSPKDYENIWLGKCKLAKDGAIYADEIIDAYENSRVTNVPYDPMLKVHVVMDLGWNDKMTIILCQRGISDVRVIGYIEDDHRTLDSYSSELKGYNYNWGQMYLPHDGQTKDFKYGISAEQIMQNLGWEVSIVPRADIESGIKLARMNFHRIYFDKNVTRLLECLKNYRRVINSQTKEPQAPLHDEYSHGADAFRYMCQSIESMTNETWGKPLNVNKAWVI